MIREAIDGRSLVKCIEVGEGAATSMFDSFDWQASAICHRLHNDPDFAGQAIHLVGFSQGGLLARAVVQRCPDLHVKTLFTFGTPHNGISLKHYGDQRPTSW